MQQGTQRLARIDANIVLRFIVGEPPDQAVRVNRLFARAESQHIPLLVEDMVLAEVVWTLRSFYHVTRNQIADCLLELFANDWIMNPDKESAQLALALFGQHNI